MNSLSMGLKNEFMGSNRTMNSFGGDLPGLQMGNNKSIFSRNIGSNIDSAFNSNFGSLMKEMNVSAGDKRLFGDLTKNALERFNVN